MNGVLNLQEAAGISATIASSLGDVEHVDLLQTEKNHNVSTVNNNTLLKQTVSLAGALVSKTFTQPLFGAKISVYQNTLGDKLINPENLKPEEGRTALTASSKEASETPKISTFHNITRNAANALITAVNVPLFIATRSSLPTLEATPPSFVTSLKTSIDAQKTKISDWHKTNKDEATITGRIARTAATLAKGVNSAHEAWGNLLKSKAVYHAVNLGVGLTALAAMGPAGWGIAGGIAAVDITRGAARVNRIQVKQDELAHLTSLHSSQDTISNLEKEHSPDFLKSLGKPNLQQSTATISTPDKTTDSLNRAAYKAALPTALKEGVSLGIAAAGAVVNHAGLAVAGVSAFLSFSTNTKSKLTEQESKDAIKQQTSELYGKTGVAEHNPEQPSRRYDLAKAAYDHAVYAKALEVAKTKQGHTAEECRDEAEVMLKKDPKFQELFSADKMEKPASTLSYISRAAKTSALSVADYLHPFKEATSYEQVHEAAAHAAHSAAHATAPTPVATPTAPTIPTQVHSGSTPSVPIDAHLPKDAKELAQARVIANELKQDLSRNSTSSERYSKTIPPINRSRSQSRGSSISLGD